MFKAVLDQNDFELQLMLFGSCCASIGMWVLPSFNSLSLRSLLALLRLIQQQHIKVHRHRTRRRANRGISSLMSLSDLMSPIWGHPASCESVTIGLHESLLSTDTISAPPSTKFCSSHKIFAVNEFVEFVGPPTHASSDIHVSLIPLISCSASMTKVLDSGAGSSLVNI